jgi:hypothetical protein
MANVDTQIKAPANYGDDITGTVKGSALTAQEVHENMIVMPREFKNAQTRAGITPSNVDNTQLYQIIKKTAVETKWEVGTIIPYLDYKAPSVWDPANPDNYFPALDLSAIASTQTIDSTGTSSGLTLSPITKLVSPTAVTWLRAFKATINRGMGASAQSDMGVTNWSIAANVATLTFANAVNEIAMLKAVGEEALVQGANASLTVYTASYQIPLNVPVAIGNIPAGDYLLSTLDPAARTVTFACVASNGSGSVSTVAAFYPFRIVGSTTTARVFAGQGRTLVGANDGLGENVAGLRRRDRFESHFHANNVSNNIGSSGSATGFVDSPNATSTKNGTAFFANAPVTDGSNPLRTSTTTDPRSLGVHLMFGLGSLVA